MKVAVTGATGFLGSHLTKRLIDEKHQVLAIGRNSYVGSELAAMGAVFVSSCLSEQKKLIEALQTVDVVFHCAALSAPWGNYNDFFNTNVIGTINVIEACRVNGVKRLLHVSTPSIYFNSNNALNVKEDAALPDHFASVYSETKYFAELEVEKAYKEGLSTVIIRPRGIFGPGDSSIVPRMIEINQKLGIPFIHKGSALIDVTYVDNVVDALILAADLSKPISGRKFNITNQETMPFSELTELLFNSLNMPYKPIQVPYIAMKILVFMMNLISTYITHKEPRLTAYTLGLLSNSQTLNIDAAIQELGYTPKVSIEEGLRRYARSMRND